MFKVGIGHVLAGLLMTGLAWLMIPGLGTASLQTADRAPAKPPIDIDALMSGPAERQRLMQAMQETLYGNWPSALPVRFSPASLVSGDYLDGAGTLEERMITIGEGAGARTFRLVVAYPAGNGPVPVVIAQTFASSCASFPGERVTSPDGDACTRADFPLPAELVLSAIFGKYIARAPVRAWLEAGFAYASFQASDFVPDDRQEARAALSGLGLEPETSGVLMAWAYAFSAAVTALSDDSRTDLSAVSVLGHSRHGKAALLAAAWDPRISAVIAHQSGFAGAALSRSRAGERLDRMARTYPHWLSPQAIPYTRRPDALAFDQHHLIALIAPRRVFLGNASRDVWSDPNSSYRAALAAGAAWSAGCRPAEGGIRDFDPSAGLSWFLRPGGHSIIEADVQAFIAFLSSETRPEGALPCALGAL